jgi:type II secretory pathway component PulF
MAVDDDDPVPRKPRPRPPEPDDDATYEVDESTSVFRPGPGRSAFDLDAEAEPPDLSRPAKPPKKPRPRPAAAPRTPERASLGADPARRGKGDRVELGGPTSVERLFFGRVSSSHLATFCRNAASYLDAGVDIQKTFASLETQFARTALGPILGRVQQGIRQGDTLAESMARESAAFDSLFLSMIRVAEARGALPEVLRNMGQHYEARARLIRQGRSAMIYPAIVVAMGLAVGWLLTVFVLPKLVEILSDMARGRGIQLPLVTRALMAISDFMQGVGLWAVPVALVVGGFLLVRFYRTPPGKSLLDRLALAVPVIGTLLQKAEIARMARTLSSLLEAGVDYGQSLDLTADVARLAPYREVLRHARQEVTEGEELSESFRRSRRFPSEVIAYVETGESTGKLPETLGKLAEDHEEQVEHMVKNLGQLLQPVIYIALGGVALFILLAFFMAYVQILTSLAGGGL